MEEIKPCPFCGSECFIESQFFGDSEDELFRVRCKDNLHALDWWEGKMERAVSVWNNRAEPEKTDPVQFYECIKAMQQLTKKMNEF